MEEQRAKLLLDVLEEYLCKDMRVMQCFSKYVEEISNQYTKHYSVIRKIKDNFSVDLGAIYAVSLVKKNIIIIIIEVLKSIFAEASHYYFFFY